MYVIDRENNRIHEVEKKTFAELGFKETEHLQEWFANNPRALGEELLIIQKEFSGFQDTHDRLDLLALDKQGDLVIIENKLDDTGKDVIWQVIKYVSYCSTLSKIEIRKIYQDYLDKYSKNEIAEEKLSEFYNNRDFEELLLNQSSNQRIIMVAGNFRKEVTSAVLWLLNFKLRIQCFKVTPYAFKDELILNVEQILPIKEAEEYTISMADKAQEDISTKTQKLEKDIIRKEFWTQFIKESNKHNNFLENSAPSEGPYHGLKSGIPSIYFYFVSTKYSSRFEIYIDTGNQEENKKIFDFIASDKENIEGEMDRAIDWLRLDNKMASKILIENKNVNVFDKDDWTDINAFLIEASEDFDRSFKEILQRLKQKIKQNKI